MSVVAPCITAETPEEFRMAIEKVQNFAERVHVDISDGEFTPNFLLGVNQIWWPQNWQVDIHVMAKRPSEYVQQLIAMKPSLVILHVESAENIMPSLDMVRSAGIKTGIALLKPTVPSTVSDLIKSVDHVMVFTGTLGTYGGVASLMQLEKVRLIKNINPEVEIGWDGGVNIDNAFTLKQGQVDVLNSGGAIMNAPDPALAYNDLVREINKTSVI